jgi:hypothetical protein
MRGLDDITEEIIDAAIQRDLGSGRWNQSKHSSGGPAPHRQRFAPSASPRLRVTQLALNPALLLRVSKSGSHLMM